MNINLTELTDVIMRSYLRGYEDGKEAKKELMDAQGIAAAVKTQLEDLNRGMSYMSDPYTEQR